MGNACFGPPSAAAKLILHGGGTRILAGGKHLAGEIMFEFPDHMVCHGGSFYIGHPIPSLSISDELLPGETYFLIPLDSVTHNVLSTSSVAALARPGTPVKFNHCPFQYLKGADGRVLIKVTPDFIERLIAGESDAHADAGAGGGYLCSTPELQKHYTQLVGPRDQLWSPKLETISEHKIRFSPCRFIGLEWKQKEVET
ncbi:hypothetical protein SASPL_126753 [Salvia splendens]|uniref:Uncharacterized protein n=1 Tax=Salvia splendens TaxID=180675 RepID=A0A8X8XHK1_SALSN|nr:uncharacterized protein LOC121749318 [Salvia splendens]KAG6414036.1 hypothetical protein SASPL_126753 [Salvia splendens]